MRIVSLVGLKKTGKTTVIEALVSELRSRGLSVAAMKGMPHGSFTIHPEGKDTRRHQEAGAEVVISAAQGEIAVISKCDAFPALNAIILAAGDVDVLVCEGLPEDRKDILTVYAAGDPGQLNELLEVRGPRMNVVAISGIIANLSSEVEGFNVPVVNITVAGGPEALADIILEP